ncbi:S8 family serine peptidase [Streptomyces sp. NPDC048845]|uniref:S8 family peptidase n=1 Tax=Streptomyces sp. NPDC048845 TaxID=3155390 RepID=UPI00343A7C30
MAALPNTRHTRWRAAAVAACGTALALGALVALPATADATAEGRILNAGAPGAIDGSYIVVLDEDAPAADSRQGRALAERHGGEIATTYRAALNGYAVELTEREARKLAADPAVASVEPNTVVRALGTDQADPPSWGLDRIDQQALPLDGSYTHPESAGKGVTAYIIDTGIRISHADFEGRASYGYDAVEGDTTADDGVGHGTHVAATVAGAEYGVAKQANVVAVRVLDENGSGTAAGVIAGVDWVTENAVKPAVANMSLGGGASDALDDAVRKSIASGVGYAVAAGNSGIDASNSSPARVGEAVTVGATTRADVRASYSNFGPALDLFAPGSSITSAVNGSDTASDTASGTSMASPHVAGAMALHLADHPTDTPAQVTDALLGSAVTGAVKGNTNGDGSPDRLLHVGSGTGGEDGGGEDSGGEEEPLGPRFENSDDYTIADRGSGESRITVSGVTGRAPADLSVEVDIEHSWTGDLAIELVGPGGTVHPLKASGPGTGAGNLKAAYTVDASAEPADGVWTLRVHDEYEQDTGFINSWALQF